MGGATTNRWKRLAAAFVLSAVICGAVQYALLVGMGDFKGTSVGAYLELFVWLAIAVAMVTGLFAIVGGLGPYDGRLALVLLPVMAAAGAAIYNAGVNSRGPGIGGDIGYAVAQLVVVYYITPCAFAVVIHWLMLRKG